MFWWGLVIRDRPASIADTPGIARCAGPATLPTDATAVREALVVLEVGTERQSGRDYEQYDHHQRCYPTTRIDSFERTVHTDQCSSEESDDRDDNLDLVHFTLSRQRTM